ncbi:CTP pyrophosphohydrolase, partial [Tetrabaena socialis]
RRPELPAVVPASRGLSAPAAARERAVPGRAPAATDRSAPRAAAAAEPGSACEASSAPRSAAAADPAQRGADPVAAAASAARAAAVQTPLAIDGPSSKSSSSSSDSRMEGGGGSGGGVRLLLAVGVVLLDDPQWPGGSRGNGGGGNAAGVSSSSGGPVRVLLAQRPEGKANAGLWEFPGGKLDPGETPEAALVRELREELAIGVEAADLAPLSFASHAYPHFHLLMPLYACRRWSGEPRGAEGQAVAWVRAEEVRSYALTPADVPLVPAVLAAMRFSEPPQT